MINNKLIIFGLTVSMVISALFYLNFNTLQNPQAENVDKVVLQQVLDRALLDEYNAINTYNSVLLTFGQIKPFVNIVGAEKRHAQMLLELYEKYNLTPIEFTENVVDLPKTISEVCSVGVVAEIENYKLYEENLIPKVTGMKDVEEVLWKLSDASKYNHLEAFKRCSSKKNI